MPSQALNSFFDATVTRRRPNNCSQVKGTETARQVGGLFVPMSVLLGALAWDRTSLPPNILHRKGMCTIITIAVPGLYYDHAGELWSYIMKCYDGKWPMTTALWGPCDHWPSLIGIRAMNRELCGDYEL